MAQFDGPLWYQNQPIAVGSCCFLFRLYCYRVSSISNVFSLNLTRRWKERGAGELNDQWKSIHDHESNFLDSFEKGSFVCGRRYCPFSSLWLRVLAMAARKKRERLEPRGDRYGGCSTWRTSSWCWAPARPGSRSSRCGRCPSAGNLSAFQSAGCTGTPAAGPADALVPAVAERKNKNRIVSKN